MGCTEWNSEKLTIFEVVPKVGLMVPKKWYDPLGSILQRFYLKIHIFNDFWEGVTDLMGGPRPNGVQTRLEYAPIFYKIWEKVDFGDISRQRK